MSGFRYERPTTVHDAIALLAEAPGGRVLAGGSDLLVALRSGAIQPALVVDVKRIPDLVAMTWTDDGDLLLGACVTLERIAGDRRIADVFSALSEGARAVGSLQIRTRATVGGNLVNASPCMDTAPPLLVLGAELVVASRSGERRIPLDAFFEGVKATALGPTEILTTIRVPRRAAGATSGFAKVSRGFGHDLALVNAAMALDPGPGTIRAAIGSCSPTPVLLPPLDVASVAREELTERLIQVALERISPIDDVRASAEYRRDMAAVLCRRLVARLFGDRRSRP
jgi:CO/xanthine dehydrogenase FAD-binding subunit